MPQLTIKLTDQARAQALAALRDTYPELTNGLTDAEAGQAAIAALIRPIVAAHALRQVSSVWSNQAARLAREADSDRAALHSSRKDAEAAAVNGALAVFDQTP